ncbi:MAG: IS1634 family transposase, partial [Deltaproteobacteria bacterium]|nr:IS1634 family transposase [Deltaproteobacteria bacterium]
ECFLCLILINFCFQRRPLFSIEYTMEIWPMPLLFGRVLDCTDFNDDVLGKLLEAIYDYGVGLFFIRLIDHIRLQEPNLMDIARLHADTTTFSVYGDYEDADFDDSFKKVRGNAKDGSYDLKLFSLFLLSNSNGIPVFMNTLSGNSSNAKGINANIKNAIEALKIAIKSDSGVHFIADASFYSLKNISNAGFNWISRVPETLGKAAELIDAHVDLIPMEGDDRYSYYPTQSTYGDIPQTWLLVKSAEMAKRQENKFERKLGEEMAAAKTGLSKLGGQPFAGEEEAKRFALQWISQHKHVKYSNMELISKQEKAKGKSGHPKNDEVHALNYYINAELAFDEEKIEKERQFLGRFILATNDTVLKAHDILKFYAEQSQVEKGFQFLYGVNFYISEVFLKNQNTIQGLTCIMSATILIYCILEQQLRLGLKKNNDILLNMSKNPAKNPTLLQIIKEFNGLTVNLLYTHDFKKFQINIKNSKKYQRETILKALGKEYQLFHDYSANNFSDIELEWIKNYLSNNV